MHIEELELKNYRNYETLSISFENNVNVSLERMLKVKPMSWNLFMF